MNIGLFYFVLLLLTYAVQMFTIDIHTVFGQTTQSLEILKVVAKSSLVNPIQSSIIIAYSSITISCMLEQCYSGCHAVHVSDLKLTFPNVTTHNNIDSS